MSTGREFLKTAAFALFGSGLAINNVFAGGNRPLSLFNVNSRTGVPSPKMKLHFFPYELKLCHVFTVAAYFRTTTPDIQVDIMTALSDMEKRSCRLNYNMSWAQWIAWWLF